MKVKVGERLLDANFSIDPTGRSREFVITIESRGGSFRNPDYSELLSVLLRALCDTESTINLIEVVSRETKGLSAASRKLPFRYPIRLDRRSDFARLRLKIGSLQRRVGSGATSPGGGNRTRRLRIVCNTGNCTSRQFIDAMTDTRSPIRRRAFALLWNPELWPVEAFLDEMKDIFDGAYGQWSVGARKSGIFEGDLILLFQIGASGRGLVSTGAARCVDDRGVDCVYLGPHWRYKSEKAPYIQIAWDQLVHPDDRYSSEEFVKRIPQVAWSHLQSSGAQLPLSVAQDLIERFHRHIRDNSLGSPEVADALAAISESAGKEPPSSKRRRGRSRATFLTAEQRRNIESRAMRVAERHLKKQGWTKVTDTSRGNPFDFHCSRASSEIWVEVKGTVSGGGSVILTRNEVRHHRDVHPKNSLIIVHSIRLTGPKRTRATGGNLVEIRPWKIRERDLDPIGFDYSTGL